MKKLFYLVLLLIVITISNVLAQKADSLKNQPDTNKTSLEIMPLKIGNYWLYNTTSLTSKRKYIITDTVRFDGELWYEMQFDGKIIGYSCNKSDGLWTKTTKNSDPYLNIKYPAKIGDKYEYESGDNKNKVEVIETNKEVNAAFGKVYAVVYQVDTKTKTHIMYYIPGIGFYGTLYEYYEEFHPELIEFNVR